VEAQYSWCPIQQSEGRIVRSKVEEQARHVRLLGATNFAAFVAPACAGRRFNAFKMHASPRSKAPVSPSRVEPAVTNGESLLWF
jgi:hypothetical protein